MIKGKSFTACEVHSGLSAKLVDRCDKFNAVWLSSLTHSAILGLPDNELIGNKERVELISQIRNATFKVLLVDIDTGGQVDHLPYWVTQLRDAGANILIMEDKVFPKQNSLLADAKQVLEQVDLFADKIRAAKQVGGIQIMARIEALIAKKSVFEALVRADAYVQAGVDGIMIHSKEHVGEEIMEFATEFRKKYPNIPLVAVPTTYPLPDDHPFQIVIHANHLLRVSLKAMKDALAADDIQSVPMADVKEIFDIVGH